MPMDGVVAANIDPIDKPLLFSIFLPGFKSFPIAASGVIFTAGFARIVRISPRKLTCLGLRGKPNHGPSGQRIRRGERPRPDAHSPEIVQAAPPRAGCRSIFLPPYRTDHLFEYAFMSLAWLAKENGFLTFFVTNGYMTGKWPWIMLNCPYLITADRDSEVLYG